MLDFRNDLGHSASILVLALVIVGASGCARPLGSVSGTVIYKGQCLAYGRVTFVCADGTVISGKIESDGTYTIRQAPTGPAKVAVRCLEEAMPTLTMVDPGARLGTKGVGSSAKARRAPMMMPAAEKPLVQKARRIPDHYQAVETSGLTYEIRPGNQTHDLRLE